MVRLATLLLMIMAAGPAWAHAGHNHGVESIPWTWDPGVTVPLGLSAVFYAAGFAKLFQRVKGGRQGLVRSGALFACGWLLLALAVVSPLHEAGERSFTLHMIEHEIIMLIAAPLLALSNPIATFLWAFPRDGRQALTNLGHARFVASPWRVLSDPVIATLLQGLAMWLWHAPALFDRALEHPAWHVAQHLSFLFSALLFWWAVARARPTTAAMCLFVTSLVGGALGALMALSSSPWYAVYAAMGMAPFGLTPQQDQQLAGLLMWIPGGLVHAGAALFILGRYLQATERRHAA
jgi:cytochrome c oxidase assembly factor CtaG